MKDNQHCCNLITGQPYIRDTTADINGPLCAHLFNEIVIIVLMFLAGYCMTPATPSNWM